MHDTHHHMGVFEKNFVVDIFWCMDFWVVTRSKESTLRSFGKQPLT